MSNTIIEFQDKIKERIRKDIGDLLPDDVLQKLLDEAIRDAFFTKIKDTYSVKEEAWFVKFVRSELKELIRGRCEQWMCENKDEMQKMIDETLKTGMSDLMASAITSIFGDVFYQLKEGMASKVKSLIPNSGWGG